jgi:hypothetical protein
MRPASYLARGCPSFSLRAQIPCAHAWPPVRSRCFTPTPVARLRHCRPSDELTAFDELRGGPAVRLSFRTCFVQAGPTEPKYGAFLAKAAAGSRRAAACAEPFLNPKANDNIATGSQITSTPIIATDRNVVANTDARTKMSGPSIDAGRSRRAVSAVLSRTRSMTCLIACAHRERQPHPARKLSTGPTGRQVLH